jgi:nucleoside-diphosphate-sugar epimerase
MAGKGLVVVTGASGFVGKWVVLLLLKAGYRVRGTVRSAAKAEQVRSTMTREVGTAVAGNLELIETDLLDDHNWPQAMAGADAVMHTAMVVPDKEPRDPAVLVRPAVEGTARVLRFANDAGVRRIIVTSSIATVGYGLGQTTGKRVYDEKDFSRPEKLRWSWAYCTGKTNAEQVAWSYGREHGMALTTIHPGMILGPALDVDAGVSIGAVTALLDGSTPVMPNIGFCVVDVRDVAAMHVAALEKPRAIGQRYIAAGRYLWLREVADILRKAYPQKKIASRILPDWLMMIFARLSREARQIINDIGNEKHFDGRKGEGLLGKSYISAEEAVLASADSAFRLELIKP